MPVPVPEAQSASSTKATLRSSSPLPPLFPRAAARAEYASLPEVRDLRVDEATLAKVEEGQEDAFFIANLDAIVEQHELWHRCLPRIVPFYAVKCNPDPWVIRILAALGTGFDCASRAEFQQVIEAGVSPDCIIYANPCKQASHLRAAASSNVRLITFDNADELDKLARLHPHAQCVLRIRVDDSRSICQLGVKFGASPDRAEALLRHAASLGLEVVGVSFHVGSGCTDPQAYVEAVSLARSIFDLAASLGMGHAMKLLDVGGGFSGRAGSSDAASQGGFEEAAAVLGAAIDKYFPADELLPTEEDSEDTVVQGAKKPHHPHPPRRNIQIIGEPGRFYVERAFTLAVAIVARRRSGQEEDGLAPTGDHSQRMYYVNDGVYGSFNCTLFDHAVVHPRTLMRQGQFHGHHWMNHPSSSPLPEDIEEGGESCSIWGPTCDGIDRINEHALLPPLDVGDWLGFAGMGAYTMCAASRFNGFSTPEVVYVGKGVQALTGA